MRWRLAIFTFLFSISLQSHAALVLPKHDSVTYDSIIIRSHEPTVADQKWIMISVNMLGVKVLGEKFLNGSVSFSYDSHYRGDRAVLGLKFRPTGLSLSSLSKPVSRGDYKQHKNNWGITQYVGGAKWGRSSNVTQYLYGAKANSEQDYIMLHWMFANANDIIKHAVSTNQQMSSRAKTGWKNLRDFTRAAYGNVNNNIKVLADADAKTPSSSLVNSSQSSKDKELERKNNQLTFQVKQLNVRVLQLRDENKKLAAKATSVGNKSSQALSLNYTMYIQRIRGVSRVALGSLILHLNNGKISSYQRNASFIREYMPSRVVGTYLDNGDFELLITADFMKKYGRIQRDMKIKGNLNRRNSLSIEDEYNAYQLDAQIFKSKGASTVASSNVNISNTFGCYNHTTKIFKNASANGTCFIDSIYVSNAEMERKTLSSASKKMMDRFVSIGNRLNYLQKKVTDLNAEKIKLSTNKPTLIQMRVASAKQQNKIMSLQKKLTEASANQLNNKATKKLKQSNNQLTFELIGLKEKVADLNSQLQSNQSYETSIGDLRLDFCVSTKLKHIYAVATNDPCIKPYIGMNQASVIGFAQASGIQKIATQPWVSIKSLTNAQVRAVQRLLMLEGLSTSKPDGLLGPKTIRGVQKQLRNSGDDQGNKVVSNQLYLQQNALDSLLENAQLAEVKVLHDLTLESRNLVIRKDDQIKRLSVEITALRQSADNKSKGDATEFKYKISQLNDQITKLQQQVNRGEREISDGQKDALSKRAEADQLSSSLTKAKKTISVKDSEITRLINELAVAKEKLNKSPPSASSFMETMSEEWAPHIGDMPLAERLFCDLYYDFNFKKLQAEKSNNQIRVNMVHRSFQEDLDSLLPGGELDQWIVKILKVSQVPNGDAAIIAELPCGVLVGSGTMNSSEGADDQLNWAATIPYSSRLYNELAKVSIGDFVNISGTFVQIEAFESGQNETFYASNSIGNNPLVNDLGLDKDLYLLELAYFMMLR